MLAHQIDGDGPLTEKKLTGGGVSRDRIALMGASRNGDGALVLPGSGHTRSAPPAQRPVKLGGRLPWKAATPSLTSS
ncbi:MAG: hypothetical protein ACOVOG_19000, partial [Rubrivivax sp.]